MRWEGGVGADDTVAADLADAQHREAFLRRPIEAAGTGDAIAAAPTTSLTFLRSRAAAAGAVAKHTRAAALTALALARGIDTLLHVEADDHVTIDPLTAAPGLRGTRASALVVLALFLTKRQRPVDERSVKHAWPLAGRAPAKVLETCTETRKRCGTKAESIIRYSAKHPSKSRGAKPTNVVRTGAVRAGLVKKPPRSPRELLKTLDVFLHCERRLHEWRTRMLAVHSPQRNLQALHTRTRDK